VYDINSVSHICIADNTGRNLNESQNQPCKLVKNVLSSIMGNTTAVTKATHLKPVNQKKKGKGGGERIINTVLSREGTRIVRENDAT
jgi:hypothetical protein